VRRSQSASKGRAAPAVRPVASSPRTRPRRLLITTLVVLLAGAGFIGLLQGTHKPVPVNKARPTIIGGLVASGHRLEISTGIWTNHPDSFAYQWQACDAAGRECANIAGATASSYVVTGLDRGHALRAVVTARNGGEAVSVFTLPTAAVPVARELAAGAPGPPIACTITVDAIAAIEPALLKAVPGEIVCLKGGNYGPLTLTDIAPAGNVTFAAAPGPPVHIQGLTIAGQGDTQSDTRNLTIQGFWIDRGVQDLTDTSGGLVFQFNTISHVRQGYGFYFDADGNGGTHSQAGVELLYNKIDHVGECLAVVRGAGRDFTFSHDVCGPGIGYGDTQSTQPGHYVEIGGIAGITVEDNSFLGPADPNIAAAGLHLNVFHLFGGGRDIDFSNNLLWHTQARGQAILFQEGHFDNVRIDNNLDVEDPACHAATSTCPNYMIESAAAHGLSFTNNTVVGAYWGVLLTASNESGDYPTGTGYQVSHNIVAGAGGGADISYGGCSSACSFDYNVTDDDSAAVGGSTHNVTHWVPTWTGASRYRPGRLPFPAGASVGLQ
jgi:hypothetical protein